MGWAPVLTEKGNDQGMAVASMHEQGPLGISMQPEHQAGQGPYAPFAAWIR